MKVLIACEFSGIVREAFRAKGHDAWSCDLLPSEKGPKYHFQKDLKKIVTWTNDYHGNWDMMIAHPPCTHLAVSGARWFKNKQKEQQEAIEFFMTLINFHIPKICVENPISIMSTRYRKPDQIIQPWQYGHGETKSTCLWLKGLPKLVPTNIVEGREPRTHYMSPGPDRAKKRSKTFQGIADAMAEQWG